MKNKILDTILYFIKAACIALLIAIGITLTIYSGGYNDVSLYIIFLLLGILAHVLVFCVQQILWYDNLIKYMSREFLAAIDPKLLNKIVEMEKDECERDWDKSKEDKK